MRTLIGQSLDFDYSKYKMLVEIESHCQNPGKSKQHFFRFDLTHSYRFKRLPFDAYSLGVKA
jgi:hypothetical protein